MCFPAACGEDQAGADIHTADYGGAKEGQPVPEGVYAMDRSHSGTVLEELKLIEVEGVVRY